MTQTEANNRKLAMDLINHFRGRNPLEMLHMLTEKCEFHIGSARAQGIVPWYGVHKGHEQIKAYLNKRAQYLARPNDNCGFEGPQRGHQEATAPRNGQKVDHDEEKLLVDGDTVVAIGHLTDHFKDGEKMHSTAFVLVFQIEGDKIKKFQYFHDTDAVVQAWLQKYPGGEYARQL
jgi:hypothetical protein